MACPQTRSKLQWLPDVEREGLTSRLLQPLDGNSRLLIFCYAIALVKNRTIECGSNLVESCCNSCSCDRDRLVERIDQCLPWEEPSTLRQSPENQLEENRETQRKHSSWPMNSLLVSSLSKAMEFPWTLVRLSCSIMKCERVQFL